MLPRREVERYQRGVHTEACSCQECFDSRLQALVAKPQGSMYCASCAHWRYPEEWKSDPHNLYFGPEQTSHPADSGTPWSGLLRSMGFRR